MNNKIKKISIISIFIALLAVFSPISFYVGIVPISLSLFIIFIISSIFPLKESLIIVSIYILLGFIGIPVFAGYKNGFEVITNATLGYIIGYIPCIIIINLFKKIKLNNVFINGFGMFLGTTVCYIFGIIFYMILYKTTFISSFSIIVLPFILIDIVKIILASLIVFNIKKNIKMNSI